MSWSIDFHASLQGCAKEREVADEIEEFVADKFVREAQGFLAMDSGAIHDDGVFETPPTSESVSVHKGEVFAEKEGSGGRDFAEITFGSEADFEALIADGECAEIYFRDQLKVRGWQEAHFGFTFAVSEGFGDFDYAAWGILFLRAGGMNIFCEEYGASIEDGGFFFAEFNDEVIQPESVAGGEEVFHGVCFLFAVAELSLERGWFCVLG